MGTEFNPEEYKGKPGIERTPRASVVVDGKKIRVPYNYAIVYNAAVKLESVGAQITLESVSREAGVTRQNVKDYVSRLRVKYGIWKWPIEAMYEKRKVAPLCARCGTAEGKRSEKTKKPIRLSAAAFDVDGKVCVECLAILHRERKTTNKGVIRGDTNQSSLHEIYQERIAAIREEKIARGETPGRQYVGAFDERVATYYLDRRSRKS